MINRSKAFNKSYREAVLISDGLFAHDCLRILENNYGKRLDNIATGTIEKMIADMMIIVSDSDYTEEIKELVNDWACSSLT